MPRVAHLSLAVLGAALVVPGPSRAGDSPRAVASTSSRQANDPSQGQVVVMEESKPVPLDHKHYGRVKKGLIPCEKCAAAVKAGRVATVTPPSGTMMVMPDGRVQMLGAGATLPVQMATGGRQGVLPTAGMPEGSRIVGCAHSNHGVCATCKALLEMPGEVLTVAPGSTAAPTAPSVAVASAPGRAVATDTAPGRAVAAGEPEPIGVMRTAYASPGAPPAGMASARPAQPAMPAQPGRAPFLGGDQVETKPHILGHLFGITPMERDFRDKLGESKKRAREKHAAISYDANSGQVEELPASMVYGRGAPR